MSYLQFLIVFSVAIGILYGGYLWSMTQDARFKIHRIVLILMMIVSLVMPFVGVQINLTFLLGTSPVNLHGVDDPSQLTAFWMKMIADIMGNPNGVKVTTNIWLLWTERILWAIASVMIVRLVIQLVYLCRIYQQSRKEAHDEYTLIFASGIKQSFSFYRWIFISNHLSEKQGLGEILEHEKIHVSQNHFVDLVLVELLAAVMWFNPIIWLMRKRIRLIHEYLADEGALSTGIDARRYQALLLNQVAEERLICLSSSFNHSLIKKRMIMISKDKSKQKTSMRMLALLPVSLLMILAIAMIKGVFPDNAIARETNRMNVLPYLQGDTLEGLKITGYANHPEMRITKGSDMSINDGDTIIVENRSQGIQEMKVRKGDKMITKTTDLKTMKSTELITDIQPVDNVLYIVDGVQSVDKSVLSAIQPDDIERIDVVKDKSKMKQYTDKVFDGIILVTTKKKK